MKNDFLKTITLLFFVLMAPRALAQNTLGGQVFDTKGNPLAYVNIGIKGGKTGTVSQVDGKFNISLPDSLLHDSPTFSSIGFADKRLAIAALKGQPHLKIVMEEQVITLAAVKITNRKLRQRKLGISGRTPMIYVPSKSDQKGDSFEQARLLHLKQPARILDANIYVLSKTDHPINIRLNFYTVENGMPGKRCIEKSIIRKAVIDKGWFRIDLKDENIYMDDDFVVV